MSADLNVIDKLASSLEKELTSEEMQEWGAKSRSLQAKKRAKAIPQDNLLENNSLKRINLDWTFPHSKNISQQLSRITSHRNNIIGKISTKVKRTLISWINTYLIHDQNSAHQDFNHFLVDTINNLAHKIVYLEDRINHLERDQQRRIDLIEKKTSKYHRKGAKLVMKKILVLGVKAPFAQGGQEILVNTLIDKIKAKGHEVDKVELPFTPIPRDYILSQAALWRALDLSDPNCGGADLVIATKFPSYYINHPNKVVWLVHQQRSIFDLYGSRYSDFTDSPTDEAHRDLILEGDRKVLSEAKKIFCISKNVTDRLKEYCSVDSEVLYPPLPASGLYKNNQSEKFIFYAGRINSIKRVELIIRALA